MPQGIVPELVIVAILVTALIVAVVASRTRAPDEHDRRPEKLPPASDRGDAPSRGPGVVALDKSEPVPVAPEAPAAPMEAPPGVPEIERPSLRDRLSRTRNYLAYRIGAALRGAAPEDVWDDLEAALIQADVGVEAATQIVADLRSEADEIRATDPEAIKSLLRDELVRILDTERERALAFAPEGVTVWLIVGVNGTGKTTTIGKLARDLRARGRSVALAAADTFRAAADEQLGAWAERAGADLVKHQPGADPGAVAFDALQHARARGTDVLIVDTAGRLHTKTPLMDELAKIRRVIEKEGRVAETLLVIDATGGQNGLVQAREFTQAVGVTGVVLTKLDGTAKGGIALAIERTLDLPIKLIGLGEGIEDLEPFDPKTFVDALLE